jgi:arylsulfatase A-like enzyme
VVTETGEVTTAPDTRYATTALVDDALEWIDQQPTQSPWLVMLAFNAPHTPFHAPPAALRPTFSDADLDADSDGECDQNRDCFRAAIEALDTELGRFLDTATEFDGGRPTVVVVLGDNGSPGQVVQPPFTREHSKDSLYEGGVHVPLIISGPTSIIAGRGATDGLAHAAVDVFATLIELAGLSVPDGVDGVSLLPMLADPSSSVRETLYTDGSTSQNDPIEGAVLRDESYKVHWFDVSVPGHYGCYDLTEDVNETHDLIVNGAPPSICATLFDALLATR